MFHSYANNYDSSQFVLGMLGFLIISGLFIFFAVIGYVVSSIFLSFLFTKAEQPKWKAWVPVYNIWVLYEIAGYKGWVSLLVIFGAGLLANIPFIGFIVALAAIAITIMVALNIQKSLNKEPVWIILYIFLPIVWLAILAFDKSSYNAEKIGTVYPKELSK